MIDYNEERSIRYQSSRTSRYLGASAKDWRGAAKNMKHADIAASAAATLSGALALKTGNPALATYSVAASITALAARILAEAFAAAAVEADRIEKAKREAARRERARKEAQEKQLREEIDRSFERFEREIRSKEFVREYRDPPTRERIERFSRIA